MNIGVRYRRDFSRTYWCTLYLRRKAAVVLTSAGVLVLLAAFLPSRSSQAATVLLAVIGIVLLVEVPVVIWLMVRRNWDALNEEVEVTVTSEEVVQRTATTSLRLSWDMMQRIISLKDMWLFYAGRLKVVTLYKGALTAAQQAELAAFIETRKRFAGTRMSCRCAAMRRGLRSCRPATAAGALRGRRPEETAQDAREDVAVAVGGLSGCSRRAHLFW